MPTCFHQQSAELRQRTVFGIVEAMECDSLPESFIGGKLPERFTVACIDEDGNRSGYDIVPEHDLLDCAALIARYVKLPEVLREATAVAGHRLYRKVMKRDFPSNPLKEKLTVTKSNGGENELMFGYDRRKGSGLTLPDPLLHLIGDAEGRIASFLWLVSELGLKYYGRKD